MTRQPPARDNIRLVLNYEPVGSIRRNQRDPRVYTDTERRRIARALQQFGMIPLIIRSDRVVLSGNIWLEAAELAGFVDVPVIIADHLSPTEAEAFLLAQVRLIENGTWDAKLLGTILRDLVCLDLDFDIALTGFDIAEIDLKIAALDQDVPEAVDELVPTGPSVCRPGDIWILGSHRVVCSDSRLAASFDQLLGAELAHITFNDPPYNVPIAGHVSGLGAVTHREFAMAAGEMSNSEFIAFLGTALGHLATHSIEGSLHYVSMDWRHLHDLYEAGSKVYDSVENLCVWSKDKGGMGSFYRSAHELIFVFKHGRRPHQNHVQLGRFGRNRTNVWSYPGANTFGRGGDEGDLLQLHPTVKPVALITDVLIDASRRGEIVLDAFLGSGSTLIAAEKVGRCARGIEIDPLYVDVAIRRWQRWTGRDVRRASDGRLFHEIEAERMTEAGDEA